ncbi:xanthine dehydrogenase family protein molybdopterin-binding subunit [Amycolatopsis acidiphila]|uniref:Xanthine dehydrogenase family protein n=1 Tax=Amycolatopsis acidiphila TaxID=715473 RepID=A0A558A667_9PSEU|nr:xanthine dehydrogenase family protein molybdopterin-binding subunit [Amycolatopsis acidiphila]TVT19742.1 xanthine dehydrogenase family protein [Amycolatopsis acidiphila]UIJ61899.1 xanthine dehydrogenase family protein molybdopterin-binding subunit [Amycolatopsis acidiphila]GHG57281.1 dehydrogenase [Amycolatopsis acidiphila]
MTMIGKSVDRREDDRLLTGKGRYLDDLELPGTLHAAFLRSPHAHARILAVDAAAARQAPGVVAVFSGADLPEIQKPLAPKVMHPKLKDFPRLPMPPEEVHYVGEPVAIVVAESRYLAEDALELIEVDYETLPAVASTAAALAENAPLAHSGADDNIAVTLVQRSGNTDEVLKSAPHTLSGEFFVMRGGGHSMEPRAVAARFEPATGQVTIWDTTQSPHYARQQLSVIYEMAEDDIRVIAPADVGGGFGPKAQFYGEEVVVPWVAIKLGRTVKWVEDRQENFVSTMMERSQTHRIEVGFDDDGHLLAVRDYIEHDQGAYCAGLQVPSITTSTVPGPYRIPNIHTELYACYTNMVPTSSVRGAGRPQAVFAMERMMDRVAEYLELDPAEVRRRNLIQADEFPYRVGIMFRDGSPLTYDSGNFPKLLEGTLERLGYEEARARQERARAEGRYVGIGIAVYVEGCGLGPYEGAKVRLTNQGKILVTLAAAGQGQGYETVYAQIAADALGLDMEHIEVATGDTSRIPFGQGTFASRITATAGPAVFDAALQMRERLVDTAAQLLGCDPAGLSFSGDRATLDGDPEKSMSLLDIARVANIGKHGITLPVGIKPGIETVSYFAPERAAYASGAHAAIVEVDPDTGAIDVQNYVIGHDCGNVINPRLVDGQVLGGFAHGIGNAMYEEPFYDAEGQPQAASYLDYSLVSATEVPPVELFHMHTPSPLNPLGVKGAGEGGTIPAPAAIANAVEDALRPLRARIDRAPVTPARISDAVYSAVKG